MLPKAEEWNDDIRADLGKPDYSGIVVYSRDWTVDTILSQLRQSNIDVNPKFQRRNAWKDKRRSLLIESLIMGVPVPELVLAETKDSKNTYVVLDGKQRLLTLAGFIDHDKYGFWEDPVLSDLSARDSLNGLRYEDLSDEENRALANAAIRCTVISNYKSDNVLYDIFYRLNTGSVPLSTQELRQVLKRGDFANYLIETTNTMHPLQRILKLSGPDARLRDVEILLRYLAFELREFPYRGDLKKFLDGTMDFGNEKWKAAEKRIRSLDKKLRGAVQLGEKLFGRVDRIGRKRVNDKWEPQFNKAVFDVQIFYLRRLCDEGTTPKDISKRRLAAFTARHEKLWKDEDFVRAVEVTTKSLDQYRTRFGLFERMINDTFSMQFNYVTELFGS